MTWTAPDRLAFQRGRRQLATVLQQHADGKPTKEALAALKRSHREAEKAVYPVDAGAAEDLALMRQWMRLIESYLESEFALERALHIGALDTLQGDVAEILGPMGGLASLDRPRPAKDGAEVPEAEPAPPPYYLRD